MPFRSTLPNSYTVARLSLAIGLGHGSSVTEGRRPSAHQAAKPRSQLWQATLSVARHRRKTDVMLTRTIAIIFGVAAVAVLNALISHPRNGDINGRVLREFDAPVGHRIEAGFFSLLGTRSDQLIISQGRFRTGVQWVADFSKGFKVIFDGRRFDVGREADDMTISDLDVDGINEIIVPITAFYGFQSWRLSTGQTPLPDIIFRYDPVQREYLPSNLFFKKCILKDTETAEKSAREIEKEISLGRLMSIVLDYVFVGEEQRAWKFFEEMCTLPDKDRIRSDIQDVLTAHPVYRHIYKQRGNR